MSADQTPLSVRVRQAVERSPEGQVRPEFREQLRARLRSESAKAPASESSAARPYRRWLAIAAGIIVVVGVGAQVWLASGFSALARLAAGDHQNCAIKFALEEKPVTLAEGARRYDAAFGRLESVTPAVSTLPGGPVRVLERHACVFQGHPFAHIVLAYKDQVVSVLVADARAAGQDWWRGAAERELPPAGGYQMASFHGGDHVVFVVASLPVADIHDVTVAMVRPMSDALAGS